MLLTAMTIGICLFLYLLPGCKAGSGMIKRPLFQRIQVEQDQHYETAFSFRKGVLRRLAFFRLLDETMTVKWARLAGLDQVQIIRALSRLRWSITFQEVLLAKLTGGFCLLASVGYVLLIAATGREVDYIDYSLVLVGLIFYLLPTNWIELADRRAKEEMARQVPAFFGIVQVLVEAGLPIHVAVRSAAARYPERLGLELARLELEERTYGTWRQALEEFAYRWEVDGLVAVVLEINRALTKGVSVAGPLSVQVDELLRQQEDDAAERTNKLSVRLIPLMILAMGVPLMFLVLGPTFMDIKGGCNFFCDTRFLLKK